MLEIQKDGSRDRTSCLYALKRGGHNGSYSMVEVSNR